jgi:hypothetical protein
MAVTTQVIVRKKKNAPPSGMDDGASLDSTLPEGRMCS